MTNVPPGLAEWVEKRSDEAHELADQIESILRKKARDAKVRKKLPETISYGELSAQFGHTPRDPTFTDALGIVSYRTLMQDGFALSALVVNKETERPGRAFYPLVGGTEKLNADEQDRLFIEELKKIKGR